MNCKQTLTLVQQLLEDIKARNIVVMPVSHLTSLMDYMIIASGTSSRHVRSIAEHIVTECKHNGVQPTGVEGLDHGEWVLIDLNDIVIHVMLPESRAFYELERLWGEFPEVHT